MKEVEKVVGGGGRVTTAVKEHIICLDHNHVQGGIQVVRRIYHAMTKPYTPKGKMAKVVPRGINSVFVAREFRNHRLLFHSFVQREREREKGFVLSFVRSSERSNWKSELWLRIDRISYARKVLRLDFDRKNCKIMIYFEKLRFSPHLSRFIAGILLLIFCNSFQLVSNFPIPIHP
ncbi:hypothetical protein VNO80_29805 [Phaseolus coccineus]|uniref:Uncharacterized protein n=1 Tax=Phaseolus coccineus TaxID=3886 RepID=A0AAN9LBL5_PHACN